MALVRAMDWYPGWLRPVMRNIFLFFKPPRTPSGSKVFLDYEWLSKQDASLMCLTYLSKHWYQVKNAELPPSKLQFGLQGTICFQDGGIVIEGGEVKSSSKGESTPLHIKFFY